MGNLGKICAKRVPNSDLRTIFLLGAVRTVPSPRSKVKNGQWTEHVGWVLRTHAVVVP